MKKLLLLIVLFIITGVTSNKIELHTVTSGDTLYDIARANHTTIEKICTMNNVKKEDVLRIGTVLKIPMQTISRQEEAKTTQVLAQRAAQRLEIPTEHILLHTNTKTTLKKKEILNTLPKVVQVPKVPQVIQLTQSKDTSKKPVKKIVKHTKIRKSIIRVAKKKLGSRYVWGATGKKNTFDCSGFTSYVYKKHGIHIPRTSRNQAKYGKYVKRDKLKKGDLVFFDTSKKRKGYVNHVGIYLGDNRFIHASSAKKRVIVSKLNKFYAQRYKGARRPS
ncbi:MAG: Invasion associated protein p60 [uncultured Sulfurovum sp.]|uniref:Invasion associated protein p60 n=1 Tax=uncultured Sulfurovum sp. TaxID=269237 RepID=A0A6S6TG33_9BACT|nr:MAG: Invasion associated protein p60 [uncultured Sulfurovum sp.]